MNGEKCIDRFYLYYYLTFHQDIQAITTVQSNLFIHQRQGFLLFLPVSKPTTNSYTTQAS